MNRKHIISKYSLAVVNILLTLLVLLCCTHTVMAQQPLLPNAYPEGTPVNSIKTWTATSPQTDPNAIMSKPLREVKQATQYFDGLGRPLQTVIKQGSLQTGQSPTDMVAPVHYDEFGREQHQFLPFASAASDGNFKTNPFQQQQAFYNTQLAGQNETFYYAQTKFEASPLNRPEESFAPGNSWVGTAGNTDPNQRRSVKMKYWINTAIDAVRIWNVTNVTNSFGTYASPGIYPAGELFKNVTVDEHGKQVIEFKDKEGKVILKKVQNTATADDGTGKDYTGWLCTYYIYDDLNNLRCVIQPRGVELISPNWLLTDATILAEQCFRYEYDARNRMIIKKVPGAGEVYMVYDRRDRLALTQDANLRNPPLGGQGGWLFTKYDALNRPVATGIYTNASATTQNAMQQLLDAGYSTMGDFEVRNDAVSQAYTLNKSFPAVTTADLLSVTYYDDYTWTGWYGHGPGYNTKDNSFDAQFLTPSNTDYPYPQPLTQSNLTKGMVTGSWTKIISTSTGTVTSVLYDDKGRAIQTKTYNVTGGIDIATTQYNWSGQPLRMIMQHQKAGTNAQTHTVTTNYEYDDLGRVSNVKKKINTDVEKTIASNQYDKLGQLKNKILSPSGGAGGGPLETLTYDYNIRGWMLGINKSYLETNNNYTRWFGMSLGYDKTNNTGAYGGYFNQAQYNGNICGVIWKTKGDNTPRKYDFTYDAVNRLHRAGYSQQSGTTWGWSDMNYSVHGFDADNDYGIKYDANGNILGMVTHAWKINTPDFYLDALRYTYKPNSNKLEKVNDDYGTQVNNMGDFMDGTNGGSPDYDYDANGNLTIDHNKKISSITYNYLNLPQTITVTGKGIITYTYDAGGNKLKKETVENGSAANGNITTTTTTTYVGGFVYESKTDNNPATTDYTDKLQFTGHEEGRVRALYANTATPNTITGFAYDYMLKDHLGNVRMVLTDEQKSNPYPPASLETAQLANEKILYDVPDAANVRVLASTVPGYPTDSYTSPNDYVHKLNGSSTGKKIGSSIVLKVMSGDKVNIHASSWYNNYGASPQPPVNPLTDLLAALINGVAGGGKASVLELTNTGVLTPGMQSFLNSTATPTTKPKAYVNWVLFNEQFQFVANGSGADPVGNNLEFKRHLLDGVPVTTNGYLYIYLSNETPNIDVIFDNLQVTHVRGPLIEETHYYPFGLVMQGISSKAANSLENRRKFNDGTELENKEFSDGSGLDLYATDFRSYDAQIGRFCQIDILSELAEDWSPYVFAYNNPILFNDPLGLIGDSSIAPKPAPGFINTPGTAPQLEEIVVVGKSRPKPNSPSPGAAGPLPMMPGTNPPPFNPGLRPITPGPPGRVVPMNEPIPIGSPGILGTTLMTVTAIIWPTPVGVGSYKPADDPFLWQRPLFDPFPYNPPYSNRNTSITLYRGVHAGHPDISNARLGMAIPIGGHNDPFLHNSGKNASIFTSWTVYKNVASAMAGRRGWGGVVLTKTFKRWQVVLSPDKFGQGEVLVPGTVTGARVENARPSN